jgi:hypothetical protein
VAAVVASGALLCAAAPAAQATTVTVAVLPPETTLEQLAAVPGMSVGVMSTGIGEVPREQSYLDISQGNRVDDVLYDGRLPPVRSAFLRVPRWSAIVRRADSAPADIVPGLLGSTLLEAGIRPEPVPGAGTAALTVVNRAGEIGRVVGGPVGVGVLAAGPRTADRLATALRGDDLLIVLAEPSGGQKLVPIGIAGSGFHGTLTSDSTRTGGYVISSDLAPTILHRFGLDVPDQMNGEPIRSEGDADVASVNDLANRMQVIPDRREPLLVACLGAWILIAVAASRLVFTLRWAAMAWLGLCFAYMPLMLLIGAWLEPGAVAEGLLVGFGAAALAAVTARLAAGWRGLAVACAATVCAYAIDVVAGSGLTRLSLLGPDPVFGARFYGIGNELEALFAVMVPAGVAAALSAYSGWGTGVSRGTAAAAFLIAGALGAIVFGAGAFGADVGAAIVLPIGAVVAVRALPTSGSRAPRSRRSLVPVVVLTALVAVAVLALIDLISGGDSHLTRTVIDAGGGGDLGDVVERRLELSAHDFAAAAGDPLIWLVVAGIVIAVVRWRRIDAWLSTTPIARAGLIGACAAVAAGVLVNDSGATFLVLGAFGLGAFLAYAWSQAGQSRLGARKIRS